MPPMMHAPTLHQQPPRIERCFPDEALWDEKLQLNLMISNLPRDALIARLVVSIAFDNVTRCVTLLPLPRYARADECRFTTLDAKEQLFYDVIQFGGPPRCLDATLTLFFVQQLPVVTKQAALRFVSASAASAQLTDPNAHRHVPHAHAHGGHAQPGHAGHAPQTQGYHHAPPPPYDGSPPQHHAAFEDRAQTYPAHGHGAPAHGAAHGYGASYASSSFALHEQRGPYAQGRPPAFDDRAHAGRKHPLYKILAKGDGQRDHSQHSPPRSPPRSPQRDHAQRDQQRDQQRYHDHRESPSPSPSPSRVAEDEEDAPPPPKKKKAAELTDVAQSLVDLLRG
ncbi:hypothetical protein M885DRAFT_296646 [Pelagophyceae sp. CCMP2097]|nr:hypothetical protein M885DRAFT_296646 [Pelagophyceae sp. CCMP2097]